MTRWTGIHLTTDKVALPADAGTQKFNFLGRSGAGKTYAAGLFVEELLNVGNQVVVIDPVGVWWGLRLAANGTDPGIAIPVFGGQRGDIPLEPTAGTLVADVIVDHGQPLVLDVSEMTGGEMRRFVADFATHLLQRKKRSRTPLMVVWDECQDFVPQRVFGDAARMVGAVERLIKQGRNFGIGTTLISQRPQAVNKDVLNQAEVLICFQLTGPQERKTVEGWIVDKGLEKHDVLDELPALKIGHAFFWSPQWLQSLRRVKFLKKSTYDVSATPTLSDTKQTRDLAPIDLEHIQQAMIATVERAKNNDPGHLQGVIRQLRQELTRLQQAKPTAPTKTIERVVETLIEVPVLGKRDHNRLLNLDKWAKALGDDLRKFTQALETCNARLERPIILPSKSVPTPTTPAPAPKPIPSPRPTPPTDDVAPLARGPRELLRALRSRHPRPLTRVQVATLAGFSPNSGTYSNYLARIHVMGAVVKNGEHIALTEVGIRLTAGDETPRTSEEILELWCTRLGGKASAMLRFLWLHPTEHFTRDEAAQAVEMSANSGTFSNYLARLNANGLIRKESGTIRINGEVFG